VRLDGRREINMSPQEETPVPRDDLEPSRLASEARERLLTLNRGLYDGANLEAAAEAFKAAVWPADRPRPLLLEDEVMSGTIGCLSTRDNQQRWSAVLAQAFSGREEEEAAKQTEREAAQRQAEAEPKPDGADHAQPTPEDARLQAPQGPTPQTPPGSAPAQADTAGGGLSHGETPPDEPNAPVGAPQPILETVQPQPEEQLAADAMLGSDVLALDAGPEAEKPEPPTILAQALALAAGGLFVFACNAEKKPLTVTGFKEATRDPERIKEQFSRPAAVLIGAPTGKLNGFDAVDIDNGTKKDLSGLSSEERAETETRIKSADDWWADHAEKFPPTRIHETRSGGLHVLVKHVEGGRNWVDFPVPGVDYRGEGGYIIWWPSAGCRIAEGSEIVEAPAFLLDLHEQRWVKRRKDRPEAIRERSSAGSAKSSTARPGRKRAESYYPDAIGKALHGHRGVKQGSRSRHAYLIANGAWAVRLCLGATACGLPRYSLDWLHDQLEAAYKRNRYIDEDGWKQFEDDWESVMAWGEADGPFFPEDRERWSMTGEARARAGAGAKTEEPSEEWPPLDMTLLEEDEIPTPHLRDAGLPPSITSLARDIAGATLSPDYTLAAIMTSAAGLIGVSREAHIPHSTWHRHASIYTCLVGVPSSTKTASGRDIINIVTKLDAETLKANEPKVAHWKADDEAAKATHDAWRDKLRRYEKGRRGGISEGSPPAPPIRTLSETPPPPPRLMVSDVTMQRLVALLRDNPKGLVLVRDEIEAFFGDMGRYSGSGADRGDYLTLWAGTKLTIDRVKEGGLAITVPRPALSLLGGGQPDKLRAGLLNETDDGMFSRFDFIWPVPPPVGSLFDARKAAAGLASLETVFRRLMAMRMETESVLLPLTLEAAVSFDGLQQELTRRARTEDGLMAGWLGKGPLKVLSYALVIEHLVRVIEGEKLPTSISLDAVEVAASYLWNYLTPMALKTPL
jgi:hypothetical protein